MSVIDYKIIKLTSTFVRLKFSNLCFAFLFRVRMIKMSGYENIESGLCLYFDKNENILFGFFRKHFKMQNYKPFIKQNYLSQLKNNYLKLDDNNECEISLKQFYEIKKKINDINGNEEFHLMQFQYDSNIVKKFSEKNK